MVRSRAPRETDGARMLCSSSRNRPERLFTELGDVASLDANSERFGSQPAPFAYVARGRHCEARQLIFSHSPFVGLEFVVRVFVGLGARKPSFESFDDACVGVLAASRGRHTVQKPRVGVFSSSFSKGLSGSTPRMRTARASSVASDTEPRPPQATTAPWRKVREVSGTTREGSMRVREPRPPHDGQAPWGTVERETCAARWAGSEIPQAMQAKPLAEPHGLAASKIVDQQTAVSQLERELDRVSGRAP